MQKNDFFKIKKIQTSVILKFKSNNAAGKI